LKKQPLVTKAIEERGMQIHALVWDEAARGGVVVVSEDGEK
jgi:hypothetical protein